MTRWIRWLVLVVLVAGGGGAAWWFTRGKAPTAPKFVTATVEKGNIVGKVTATGTLSAIVTVQVGAQVSGRLLTLGADFNSKVTKGQVLATLDPSLFEATAAQTRANEKAAEANVARAKAMAADSLRKLNRSKQLAEQRLVAQADLDAAQADFEVNTASVASSEASLLQARASRQQAEVNLTYTTIRSPIDGTVISRAVDVGQTVAASLQAPTLFTIAENLARMQVDTNVAEADVGKLKEGLEATFMVDAFPNRPFKGTIRQIRFAPVVVQNVVTYDAVIDVENPELLLRPGMTANVSFIYARADDTVRLPNAALRFRLDEGTAGRGPRDAGAGAGGGERKQRDPAMRAVWVLRADGNPERAMVKAGLTDGSFTEVLEGDVKEGDLVITDKPSDGSAPKSAPPGGGQGGMGGMRRMF
jgi:HlyD family secretion protein